MFEVRPCADQDDYSRAIGAIGQYFNPPPTEEFYERWAQTLPQERMHAAFDEDRSSAARARSRSSSPCRAARCRAPA
jgi:hypothetical protein